MLYKTAICDDSAADRDYIENLTRRWAAERRHTLRLSSFASAESFLFHYEEEKDFDILLLDIEMEGMNGVSLATQVKLTMAERPTRKKRSSNSLYSSPRVLFTVIFSLA